MCVGEAVNKYSVVVNVHIFDNGVAQYINFAISCTAFPRGIDPLNAALLIKDDEQIGFEVKKCRANFAKDTKKFSNATLDNVTIPSWCAPRVRGGR